jgi:ankyrin repeat protein
MDSSQYLRQVKEKNKRPPVEKLPNDTPRKIVELLQKCWVNNPEERPSVGELLDQWEAALANATVDQVEGSAKRRGSARVRKLQEQGSLDTVDDAGDTALHRLIKSNELNTVDWLLLDEKLKIDMNIQDGSGKTILHLAVENSLVELAEVMSMRYPNFGLEDYNGNTVASYVLSLDKQSEMFRKVYLEYAKLLAGPLVDLLEQAAKRQDSSSLRDLQDRMSLDIVDDKGDTVFHRLIKKNDIDPAVWMLDNKNFDFDVDGQDKEGKTLLHLATERSNIALIDAIKKRKPKLDVKDNNGRTVSSHVKSLGKNSKVYQRIYA